MKLRSLLLPFIALSITLHAQAPTDGSPLRYPEFGFRYTPPKGLLDFTAADKKSIQDRAAALHTANVLDVLLSLQSPSGDSAQDWQKVGIQTYPRNKLAGLDDQVAIRKVSHWVSGPGTESGEPREVRIGGLRFAVFSFELRERGLVRLARVYATVSKGHVVALSLTANSPDVLSRLETTTSTIETLP